MTEDRYTRTGAATWSCRDCPRPAGAVITDRAIHDAWHLGQRPPLLDDLPVE